MFLTFLDKDFFKFIYNTCRTPPFFTSVFTCLCVIECVFTYVCNEFLITKLTKIL